MQRYLLFLLGSILLLACEKDVLPNQVEDEPKYRVSLMYADEEVEIEAGKNNYYLFTDYYSLEDTYIFSSSLRPYHCDQLCADAVEIGIRGKAAIESGLGIGNHLTEGMYEPGMGDTIKAYAFSGQVMTDVLNQFDSEWLINGTKSASPTFEETIYSKDPVEVCLELTDPQSQHFLRRCYYLSDGSSLECTLNGGVSIEQDQNVYRVQVQSNGTPPFSYRWSNGSTEEQVTFPDTSQSFCVTVTDANDCRTSICRTFEGNFTAEQAYGTGYNLEIDSIYPVMMEPREVFIRYRDDKGVLYSTPSEGSYGAFSLFNIREAGSNEKQQAVYGFSFDFDTRLENKDGDSIQLKGNGEFAIAFPR